MERTSVKGTHTAIAHEKPVAVIKNIAPLAVDVKLSWLSVRELQRFRIWVMDTHKVANMHNANHNWPRANKLPKDIWHCSKQGRLATCWLSSGLGFLFSLTKNGKMMLATSAKTALYNKALDPSLMASASRARMAAVSVGSRTGDARLYSSPT